VTVARRHGWVARQKIGMTGLKIKRSESASFEMPNDKLKSQFAMAVISQ